MHAGWRIHQVSLKGTLMKNTSRTWLAAGLILLSASPAPSQTTAAPAAETKGARDARMAWWREARFGMFIHWGVYAVPAGFYQDKPVDGIGEWIMNRGRIPMAGYQAFAREFNPVKYDADAWVSAAKDAGMKYIVITTKHHDGFALFDTKASDWNVVKATPYGKDLIKPLAEACRKHGIRLGFYYSQAQDWNNGGSAAGGKWDPAQQHGMDEYIDKVAVPQVREILTQYGEDIPAVIWWDTPTDMNPDRAAKLYKVVQELRPDLIMNDRLGGGYQGDTSTPEQHIPAKGFPGRDWETCMTMNNTWGFKRDDDQWKSTETLIRNLCDIASKGGNYLLNVGPTAEGLIPQPSLDRLAEIGRWMKINGEAIHGTSATVFGHELGKPVKGRTGYGDEAEISSANDWRCTTKPGKIYLHIFKWPANGRFELAGLQSKVTKAYLLADHKDLKVDQSDAGVAIALPAEAPDKIASVICVEIADQVAKVAPQVGGDAK
jgi:alpha-L-fucosidase